MVGKAGLITVIGFSLILGYISLNMARVAKNSTGVMASYADATLSHNLATSGINIGLARFYSDTSWIPRDTTQTLNGPSFYGSIRITTTAMGGDIARLRSISTYTSPTTPVAETLHDTVEVYFDKKKRQSFTMFAWMTQFEGNVFWITGDTVWGRVHSNGALHVNGKPVFMEKATTSKSFDPKPGTGTNKAIFKSGYETGVALVRFPDDLSEINAAASAVLPPWGKKYASDIWVTLLPGTGANGDGKAVVRNTSFTGTIIDSIPLSSPLFNGVIGATGNIHVKGTVDGKLTLGALDKDVIVEDDVRYEKDPMSTSSDDLLGLVANNSVVVADNAANNSNCIVDACIFARAESFTAENYNSRPVSGELRVLGSLVQNQRGIVAQFSGSTINHGFSKRYRYDTRLSDPNFRPPYYPGFYVKTYAITNWWESFRVPSINQ